MKKSFLFIVMLLGLLLIACGCSKDEENTSPSQVSDNDFLDTNEEVPLEKIDINIAALTGPTVMGMAQIMENNKQGIAANKYNFSIAGTADEIVTGLIKGDIDIATIPCNLASVLYNKTGGKIQVAAVNTLGVLYVLETGDSIKSVSDLKGKKIFSTGKGTTPEYILNYILGKNGLDVNKDVTVVYKSEAAEVAAMLSDSDDAVAVLPQPYVTTAMKNNKKLRVALDFNEEWSAIEKDSNIITGVLVARKEFIDNNTPSFDAFLNEYSQSVEYTTAKVDNTAKILEEFNVFKAAIAKEAIPECNIAYFDGDIMKEKIEKYLKILYSLEAPSVGGKLPGNDFYYIKSEG